MTALGRSARSPQACRVFLTHVSGSKCVELSLWLCRFHCEVQPPLYVNVKSVQSRSKLSVKEQRRTMSVFTSNLGGAVEPRKRCRWEECGPLCPNQQQHSALFALCCCLQHRLPRSLRVSTSPSPCLPSGSYPAGK